MKFALFYEIPVPKPWGPTSEQEAYRNTIEEAVFGEEMGFHAFWTVEHHFLDEYSHCSNPEVLYGAIAAKTERMRLGYGVRLMPKPYNHPVRTAESVAVLDVISGGRVDFGTGRSSTRAELEGFDVDVTTARQQWAEAIGHVVGCWTNEEYEFQGEHWSMPRRNVHPKPVQDPHPPIFGATSSESGHYEVGRAGVGLCSFTVGVPPEELIPRIENYRRGQADCTEPLGAFRNEQVATFTMVLCAPTNDEADEVARESFEWYPAAGARLIGSVATWLQEKEQELGTYSYAGDAKKLDDEGLLDALTYEYIRDTGSSVVGDPDRCVEMAKRYEEVGVDLLLCLVNPYKIPHDKVMQTIELMGRHVIPEFE